MLRGVGATLALPLLDAMLPAAGVARSAMGAVAGKGGSPIPLRMAAIFLPNGVHYADWEPTTTGRDYKLSRTLEPLQGIKDDLLVLSNLALDNAKAKGDGAGDHARSAAAFLTGTHPFKTGGSNIKLGVSMDQVAAQAIGHMTRLPSLELGLDRGSGAGDCDSGYACAYVSNVSWSSDTTPMPKEVDPAAVFDRMFGTSGDRAADESARQRRLKQRKSVLDFVADDTRALNRKLGAGDRHKIDEFTTSVREIEKRIDAVRKLNAADAPKPGDFARPADGMPADVREHIMLMWDLMALAFQTDVTRVSTFMMAGDGSDRRYTHLGLTEGHHTLSHHQNEEHKIEAIKKIDQFHMEQFARFVERLKSIREGDGTLLDHSMILCGAGIGDGNAHNHDVLPILLAGRGGGTITPGRHVRYGSNTPLCNLYVSMLQRMTAANGGADLGSNTGGLARFGDSTGPLAQLTA
jgi:hypothetical protein